jgi:membrane peptidoglycan carboxypeptidase
VGYTPQLSAAVMFYRGDGTETLNGVGGFDVFTGGRYPARLWTAFMRGALDGMPVKGFPEPAWIGGKPEPPPVTVAPAPVQTSQRIVIESPTAPGFARTGRPWPKFLRPSRGASCFPFCEPDPTEPPSGSWESPRDQATWEPEPRQTRGWRWRDRTPVPEPSAQATG